MDTLQERTSNWLQQVGWGLLDVSVALVTAVVYIGIGVIIGRFIGSRIGEMLSARAFGRNGALLIGRLITVVCITIAVLALLGRLGANWTGLLTFVSAGAVAISLSIQDVLRNLVAGIYLLLERPFRIGDRIRVRDVSGDVQGIDIRTTLVRDDTDQLIRIPNAIIFSEILANRSYFHVSRIDFTIVGLQRSVHDVEQAVATAVEGLESVRRPIPAPRITGAKPDGRTMILSLLVDRDQARQAEVIERVLDSLPDLEISVERS